MKQNRAFFAPLVVSLFVILILLSSAVLAQSGSKTPEKKGTKEIAISFDQLPAAPGFRGVDYDAIMFLALDALKKHDVKAIGFVAGSEMEARQDLLGSWLNAGHKLGSMTYSNQDYNELGIEQFINEIRMGNDALEGMLSGFGQKERYFRYPFLHYGTTVKAKREAADFLASIDNVDVPATILPEDYLYNLRLTKMGKEPDSTEFYALMNEYINQVLDEIERCELVAKQVAGRPVRQILALQMNRLNAVYLDEMLGAIEQIGYKFIPIDRALRDEIYSEPEAYYGTARFGWLDRILASDPDLMPAE